MASTDAVAIQSQYEEVPSSADDPAVQHSLTAVGGEGEDELDRLIREALHDEEQGTLEAWQVLTHIFKAFVGTGVLGLPSAVMHGGIIAGPIILLLLGVICMYNIKLLVDTAKNIRLRLGISRISYSGISEHLFNSYGYKAGAFAKYRDCFHRKRVVTDMFLCSLQLGFCCVYIVFIAHNIQVVAGKHDVRIWMVVVLPFILLPSLISNIGHLAYFTTLGNVIILVGLGIIYEYLFTHVGDPVMLPQFNGFTNLCVSFGQIVYAFEGIAVVGLCDDLRRKKACFKILPTENKLREKDSFNWLMKIAGSIVITLYSSMGIFGYLTFGAETLGSITLNLPQTSFYQILQVFFALMVYFTYPLQLLVSVEIIKYYTERKEEKLSKEQNTKIELIIRSILVFITCVLAICIPQLDNFMALVGSISGVAVGMILPPILHSLCFWNQGLSRFQLFINVFILCCGLFAFVTGTSATLYSIFHRFVNEPGATKLLIRD